MQGTNDMDAGRYETACPPIEESYTLDPRPGTLITLAECEAKRGRIATAVKRYEDYLTLHAALTPEKKRKQGDREKVAREQKAMLSPLVPELLLTLPRAPHGTVVSLDGAPLTPAALGAAVVVDPGEHVITVRVPQRQPREVRVAIGRGEKRSLLLEVPPAPAVTTSSPDVTVTPPMPQRQGPSGQRIASIVTGSVGIAGLVVGAITGAVAVSKKGVLKQHCGIGGDPTACDHEGKLAADGLETSGLISTIGFGIGIAGAATGIALFVAEPKAQPAGAMGAIVGARGVW
ncbi:Hypothetical protein A7982_04905 [Minicystis rosea]|nr:Hypothetical protein A7982_04905 [Minicystis rosea]